MHTVILKFTILNNHLFQGYHFPDGPYVGKCGCVKMLSIDDVDTQNTLETFLLRKETRYWHNSTGKWKD